MSTTGSAGTVDVVVLVHGIRTVAEWQNEIRGVLEENGFSVAPIRYTYVGAFEFLLPLCWLRNRPVKRVLAEVRDVRARYGDARLSFIAHSFGSRIVSKILAENPDVPAYRIIFCGSVVPEGFRFDQISDRFCPPLLNECGTRDYWPVVAASVTWGYGATGAFGFGGARVRDRWHNRKGHSAFLTADFCRRYWVPFLKDGTIEPSDGDESRERTPKLIKFLVAVKLRRVLVALALIAALLIARSLLFYRDTIDYRIPASQGVGYLNNTISSIVTSFQEPCGPGWMPSWTPDSAVQWLTGRHCVSVDELAGEVKNLVVCAPFECRACKPLEALIKLKQEFGACLSIEGIKDRRLRISVKKWNTSAWKDGSGKTWQMCACSREAIKVLESRHGTWRTE